MSFTNIERAERQADERKKKHNPPASEQSLRDYFAAKAMQTFLQTINGVVGCNRYEYRIAENAYEIADAMLRAREAS